MPGAGKRRNEKHKKEKHPYLRSHSRNGRKQNGGAASHYVSTFIPTIKTFRKEIYLWIIF